MKIKIRTVNPIMPTSTAGMQYISREITNFNFDFLSDRAVPIILERLFTEKTIYVKDENGDPIEEIDRVERIELPRSHRNFASEAISLSQVSALFTQLGNDIISTEDFSEELKKLLQDSLLLDTRGVTSGEGPMYQIPAEDWMKENSYTLVNTFSE